MSARAASNQLAAFALVAALAIAGCGGDDETTSTTTSGVSGATGVSGASLTHEEFVKQADAICLSGDKTLNGAGQSLGQSPTEADLEGFVDDTVVPALQGQYDAIAALPAPEGEEDQVDDLLSQLQDAIDTLADDPTLITAGDSADGPFADVNQAAQDFGLTECGDG
jgi:hypothetical protein